MQLVKRVFKTTILIGRSSQKQSSTNLNTPYGASVPHNLTVVPLSLPVHKTEKARCAEQAAA